MEYEIIELKDFSGPNAKIFSVALNGKESTLFDDFLAENVVANEGELLDIIRRLKTIGHQRGALEDYFKLNEGRYGDKVCALYDKPGKRLRLFCIRISNITLILGGGGPKQVRAWQNDPKLDKEANQMIDISKDISNRISARDIFLSDDGSILKGRKQKHTGE